MARRAAMAACDLCAFAAPRLGRAGRMAPCDLCACAAPRLGKAGGNGPLRSLRLRRAAACKAGGNGPLRSLRFAARQLGRAGRMAPCNLYACASPRRSMARRAAMAACDLCACAAPRQLGKTGATAPCDLCACAAPRLGRAGGNGCLDCVFRSFRPHQADVRSCLFKIRQRPSFPLRALPRHISGGSGRILSCHNPVKKTDLPAFLPWLLPPGFVVRARLHLGP